MNYLNVSKESAAFWRVSINNPPVNLVDSRFLIDMRELVDAAEADPDLMVIVFESANPEYFLAHWDLTDDMSLMADQPQPVTGRKFPFPFMDMVVRLSKLPALTITSLRGRARGAGSEFILATDITFASRERTLLGQFEMSAMAPPGGGAPSRLARLIGRNRALEVLIGAEDFTGPQAELYGYVNRAIPDDELDEFVTAFANRVARFDRTSLIQLKQGSTKSRCLRTTSFSRKATPSAKPYPGPLTRAGLPRPSHSGSRSPENSKRTSLPECR